MRRSPAPLPLVLAALLAAPAAAQEAPSPDPAPSAGQPADARTRAIVAAAQAFLATLDEAQRDATVFTFDDDAQRANWSNFPEGAASRAGVRWGELDEPQRDALVGMLGAVLSPEGVDMVLRQMAADDVVAARDAQEDDGAPGGGPGGGPDDDGPDDGDGPRGPLPEVEFGSDHYFVSFVGEPSATSPFTIQYGGHHLAINATVAGPRVTLSPTLTGGEPLRFAMEGTPVFVTEDEVTRAWALLAALTDEQRGAAVVSEARSDLLLGPGQDGRVPPPEGLPGAAMDLTQQALLLALIEARLGMLNEDDLAPLMAEIEANLDETHFGWWGPAAFGAGYVRITGPSVLIEYSPEDLAMGIVDHAHNMYRDPTNEYGAAWADLE